MTCFEFIDDSKERLLANAKTLVMEPGDTELLFPGPQPVSIDTGHFDTLRNGEYMISPKTDGVRCCLMASDVDGIHTVCLFDRTMKRPYGIFIRHLPRACYQGAGTLLDGELVMDRVSGKWTFLAFDVITICCIPQFHKPYVKRLQALGTCLAMAYVESPEDTVRLDVKTCVPLSSAPMESHGLHDPRFPSDGYVYMPVRDPIVFGHHNTFFKLKSIHSVDCLYQKGYLMVYNQTSKRHVRAGIVADGQTYPDGTIVECVLERDHTTVNNRQWKVLNVRQDKDRANTLFVLEKTLLNMRENLSYETIRGLASK
jgi:hypothetical protein